MTAIRHIVVSKWNDGTTAEQHAEIVAALRQLPGLIPEIRRYEVGTDACINDGNHDLVVVADFDDVAGYLVYRDHPEHQRVIAELIRSILASRAAVQFERAGPEEPAPPS